MNRDITAITTTEADTTGKYIFKYTLILLQSSCKQLNHVQIGTGITADIDIIPAITIRTTTAVVTEDIVTVTAAKLNPDTQEALICITFSKDSQNNRNESFFETFDT